MRRHLKFRFKKIQSLMKLAMALISIKKNQFSIVKIVFKKQF